MPRKNPNEDRIKRLEGQMALLQASIASTTIFGVEETVGKRASRFLRENAMLLISVLGIVVAVASVVVGLAAIIVPIYVAHRTEDLNLAIDGKLQTRLSPLDDRVNGIQTTLNDLRPFIQELVTEKMERAGALAPSDFRKALPSVAKAISAAGASKAVIDEEVVFRVSQKLDASLNASSESAVGWETAAQLINYRSMVTGHFETETIKDCFITFNSYTPHPPVGATDFDDMTLAHCELQIDNLPAFWSSPFGKIYTAELAHNPNEKIRLILNEVRVVSHGEEAIPFDSLICIRCTFSLLPVQSPSPPARQLIRGLLLANLENLSIDNIQAESNP